MIEGETEVHHGTDDDLLIDNDGLVGDAAHTQDGSLPGDDDGIEDIYSERAQVGDAERAAGKIIGSELAGAGAVYQALEFCGDRAERFALRVFDDWNDE